MDSRKSIKSRIIAHLDGELCGSELEKLLEWIEKSDENARYYTEVKDLWEASLFNISEIAETEKEWKRFVARVNNDRKNEFLLKRFLRVTYFRVAAILVLGIMIGVVTIHLVTKKDPVFCTAIAPKGSISQTILPDSTIIYLNAGSKVIYSINTNRRKREVYLTGEAWFKVSHNPQSPFVVHTDYYDVNVLGTEFNVKAYPGDKRIETTLEKGMVQISSSEKLKIAGNIILNPGEQLVYNKDKKKAQVVQVNTRFFTSWKDNKLEFIKMSLKDLIVLLERRYGVNIKVEDPEILKYHYSGTIKNESILELLDILGHTLAIRHRVDDQTIIIYKK